MEKLIIAFSKNHLTHEDVCIFVKEEFDGYQMQKLRMIVDYFTSRNACTQLWFDQVLKIADPRFNADQMEVLSDALIEEMPEARFKVLLNPKLSDSQMLILSEAAGREITVARLKKIANVKYNSNQMDKLCDIYEGDCYDKEQIKIMADPKFSAEQMQELIDACDKDLSIKQLEKIANPAFCPEQMEQLTCAYEDMLTDEQVDMVANADFDTGRMYRLRKMFKLCATTEEVKKYIDSGFIESVYKTISNSITVEIVKKIYAYLCTIIYR